MAYQCVPTKGPTQVIYETVGAGAESQSASTVCWGGVTSVMGSSDLDEHSFVPLGHKVISIKAHCLIDGTYGNVGVACQNGLVQVLGADVAEEAGLGA